MASTVGTILVNTAFGGYPTQADLVVKTLGNVGLTVFTESMRRGDGTLPLWASGLSGFLGTIINSFDGAKAQHNLGAMNLSSEGSELIKDARGYITGELVTSTDGSKITYRSFNGEKFSDVYTAPANAEIFGLSYLAGSSGVAFIPTLEVVGSIVHENGIASYYGKSGNFMVAIPDNQIPIYSSSLRGKAEAISLIATELPVSMMTLGMGQDILFSPLYPSSGAEGGVEKLEGGQMMGVMPMGANPVIIDGNLIGSFRESQDGTLTYYDSRGMTSYSVSRDGDMTFYRTDGSKEVTYTQDGTLSAYDSRGEISYSIVPDGTAASYGFAEEPFIISGTTQVEYDSQGNYVFKEQDNSYKIYESQTHLLLEEGTPTLLRSYQYDDQNRLYGIIEEDLTQQRQNLYGADGEMIFTMRQGATEITNICGEAVGSTYTTRDYDGIEIRQWEDALGNRVPIDELYQGLKNGLNVVTDFAQEKIGQGVEFGKWVISGINENIVNERAKRDTISYAIQQYFGEKTQAIKDYLGSERFETLKINLAWAGIDGTYQLLKYPAIGANYAAGNMGKLLTTLGFVAPPAYGEIHNDEMPGLKAGYGKYDDPASIMSQYSGGIFAPQYLTMIKQMEMGGSPSWKNYLASLNPEVGLFSASPELISRVGPDQYTKEKFIAALFGDEKSGYGVAYPSPFVKWHTSNNVLTYGAGVGNDSITTYQSAKDMADLSGQPVLYALNPSHKDDVLGTLGEISIKKGIVGVIEDVLVQSPAGKFSNMLDATTMAQFNLHLGILRESPEANIIHTAHSQNDIITTNEASYMKEEERDRINYITLGGAGFSNPHFANTDPYANPFDPVPLVGKVGKIITNLPSYAYGEMEDFITGGDNDRKLMEFTYGNNYHLFAHPVTDYLDPWKVGMKKLDMPINEEKNVEQEKKK